MKAQVITAAMLLSFAACVFFDYKPRQIKDPLKAADEILKAVKREEPMSFAHMFNKYNRKRFGRIDGAQRFRIGLMLGEIKKRLCDNPKPGEVRLKEQNGEKYYIVHVCENNTYVSMLILTRENGYYYFNGFSRMYRKQYNELKVFQKG